jgi:hypothetical protein
MSTVTINATEMIINNYATYGRYANNGRATVGVDGLKNVERRILLAVREEAPRQFVRSSAVIGRALAKYHPHGEASIYNVLCRLVVRGLVEGHGNFGSYFSDDPAAAMRYTSVKAKDKFSAGVFRFVDFVPVYENEFGIEEPKYLPTPIPLALLDGSVGIGVGLLMNIPVFSAASLYTAMKKDDPTLLKAPKGLSLVSGNFEGFWTKGSGHIQYGLRCYQEKSEADENRIVSIIEGSPRIFVPDLMRIFAKEIEEELIYVRNESVNDIRFIISRVKGIKRITDEEMHAKANQAATKTLFCRLYVSDGEVARITPLRDWLWACWKNYCAAFDKYQQSVLSSIEYKIHIFELIPKTYPLLLEERGTQEIARLLSEPLKVIQDIEGKPLRLLRKKDFDEEIRDLKREVREIRDLTAEKIGEDFIQTL